MTTTDTETTAADGMKICFVDTETTSLRHDRRAWEIAVIVRHPDPSQRDEEFTWYIELDDLDLGNADLMSLNIGRFFDRHPDMADDAGGKYSEDETDVLAEVEEILRGATVVGAVPGFDAEVLGNRMRDRGICPSWHYHLQDFETLIAGYLRGRGEPVPPLPWRSDDLSRLIGVEPPAGNDRHTAMGDARWARSVWDTIMTIPARLTDAADGEDFVGGDIIEPANV